MKRIAMLTILISIPATGVVGAETYAITRGAETNEVIFHSKAPLESFEGKTREVWGSVEADLADLSSGVLVHVEVDLASLDTGIKLRNQHMCENHLETDEYPLAVFHATEILDAPSAAVGVGDEAKFRLAGEFTLHGVTRELELPVTIRSVGSGGALGLEVESAFKVNLADYAIKRPKFLMLKLNEVQSITVQLTALSEGGS